MEKNKLIPLKSYATNYPNKDIIDYKLLPKIDKPQSLTVVASMPKQGKTSLLTQIAVKIARQNRTVAYFVKKGSGEQIFKRLKRYTPIPDIVDLPIFLNDYYALSKDDIDKKITLESIEEYLAWRKREEGYTEDTIKEYNDLYARESTQCFWELSLTPSVIRKQCEELRQQQGNIGLIVIDDMPLFSKESHIQTQVQNIANELKQIAVDFNCAVLISSEFQVPLRKDMRSRITDIKAPHSHYITKIADNIVMLYHNSSQCENQLIITLASHLPSLTNIKLVV